MSQTQSAKELSKQERANLRYARMGSAPISKVVTSMAIPSVVSMLVTSLYNMADTYFVSGLSTAAAGAVGIIMPLMMTIQAAGMTFGVGAGSYISRLLGQNDKQRASETLTVSLYTAGVIGLLIMVFGLVFMGPLVRLLGASATIAPEASSYAAVILYGAPVMSCSFVMNSSLRSEGSSFLSMVGIGAGGVLNCILDPLFIYTFNMGIAGAAWATILSQFISFCILLSQYVSGRSVLSIHPRHFKPKAIVYGEVMRMGAPSFFRQFTNTFAVVLINNAAKGFGDEAVAAIGITSRVMMFFFSAMLGFGQGFQPVAGYNFGAKQYDRTLQSFWFTFRVMLTWTAGCCLLIFFFAPTIIGLFRPGDENLIRIGTVALRAQALALPLQAWVLCSNQLCQAIGRGWAAAIMALSRNGFCFIPLAIILPPLMGLTGVEICQALADLLALIIAVPLSLATLRYLRALQQEQPVAPEALTEEALEALEALSTDA